MLDLKSFCSLCPSWSRGNDVYGVYTRAKYAHVRAAWWETWIYFDLTSLTTWGKTGSMDGAGHYPPPDFGGPPSNSSNISMPHPQQQQPQQRCSSSFQPSMWSWCETPVEPSWEHGGQAGWGYGPPAGFGGGSYGPRRPYGEWPIPQGFFIHVSICLCFYNTNNVHTTDKFLFC